MRCECRILEVPGQGWGGGPLTFWRLRLVATFQRVAPPIYLASCWQRTKASSPWPSPPEEERETAPRPVHTAIRVRAQRPRAQRRPQTLPSAGAVGPCCAQGCAHSRAVAFARPGRKTRHTSRPRCTFSVLCTEASLIPCRHDRARAASTDRPHLRALSSPQAFLFLRLRLLPAHQPSARHRGLAGRREEIRAERGRFPTDHGQPCALP